MENMYPKVHSRAEGWNPFSSGYRRSYLAKNYSTSYCESPNMHDPVVLFIRGERVLTVMKSGVIAFHRVNRITSLNRKWINSCLPEGYKAIIRHNRMFLVHPEGRVPLTPELAIGVNGKLYISGRSE